MTVRPAVVAVMAVALCGAAATPAKLTCDQLVASAQAGIAMRDRGASLSQVLTETGKGGLRDRFSPEDLAILRRALQLTFNGEISLHELSETCAESKKNAPRS